MSKNKSRRSSGAVGFIVALLLLGFVIFAGETDRFGAISEGIRTEFTSLLVRSGGGYHLTVAKVLAAAAALALVYLICRIVCFLRPGPHGK